VEQVVSACGLEKDSQTGAAQLRVQFNKSLLGMCRRSFLAIYIQKRSFHQDRLGTNIGQRHNKDRFLSGGDKISLTNYSKAEQASATFVRVGKPFPENAWENLLYINRAPWWGENESLSRCRFKLQMIIILPRQARHKKWGKHSKKTHFCRWGDDSTWIQVDIHASADGSGFVLELDGKKEELAGKTITGVKYGQGIPVS
jgi:hypothetical protein